MGPGRLCLKTGSPPLGTQNGGGFVRAEASGVFPHGVMGRGSMG